MSEETIQKIWADSSYRASFSGARTFYNALKEDRKVNNVTYGQVLRALSGIPVYQKNVRRKKNYLRRKILFAPSADGSNFIAGQGIDFHADLAEMPMSPGKKNIMLRRLLFDQ